MTDLKHYGKQDIRLKMRQDERARLALELERLQNIVHELGAVGFVTDRDIARLTRLTNLYEISCNEVRKVERSIAQAEVRREKRARRLVRAGVV